MTPVTRSNWLSRVNSVKPTNLYHPFPSPLITPQHHSTSANHSQVLSSLLNTAQHHSTSANHSQVLSSLLNTTQPQSTSATHSQVLSSLLTSRPAILNTCLPFTNSIIHFKPHSNSVNDCQPIVTRVNPGQPGSTLVNPGHAVQPRPTTASQS